MPIRRNLAAIREQRAAWRVCGGARLDFWPEGEAAKIRLHVVFRPAKFWVQPLVVKC